MELASALKPDVFRAFAIYICPGAVAVLPWMLGVFWPEAQAQDAWRDTSFATIAVFLLASLSAGLILEDMGSRIETHLVDRRLRGEPGYSDVSSVFWRYLRTKSAADLVAHRFLSATVTRYKFELSMVPSLLIASAGTMVAFYGDNGLSYKASAWISFGAVAASLILLYEATDSARLLHNLRVAILRGEHSSTKRNCAA